MIILLLGQPQNFATQIVLESANPTIGINPVIESCFNGSISVP
jgi:hypothetical protein